MTPIEEFAVQWNVSHEGQRGEGFILVSENRSKYMDGASRDALALGLFVNRIRVRTHPGSPVQFSFLRVPMVLVKKFSGAFNGVVND